MIHKFAIAATAAVFLTSWSAAPVCAQQPEAPEPETATKEEKSAPPTQEEIIELTKLLSDDEFRSRENAQIKLTKILADHPDAATDLVLKKYIKATAAPEERYRLRSILYGAKQAAFKEKPPGFVGISMRSGNALGKDGVLVPAIAVMQVFPGSAAAKHGLQLGDQIVQIDDKTFDGLQAFDQPMNEFAEYVTGKFAGEKVTLLIMRANKAIEIPLVLGQRPEDLFDPRVQNQFDRQFKSWLDENTLRLGGTVVKESADAGPAPEKPVYPVPSLPDAPTD